jgi:hypothetical protein
MCDRLVSNIFTSYFETFGLIQIILTYSPLMMGLVGH